MSPRSSPLSSPWPSPPQPLPPPGSRSVLPEGFIKPQRTETGTHGARSGCGGVAYSCRQPPWHSRCPHAHRCLCPSSSCPLPAAHVTSTHVPHAQTPSLAPAPLPGQCRGSPRRAPAVGLAAAMHVLKHHEDAEMDRTGKHRSWLSPGRDRTPTSLPSHPTCANKTRHKHGGSPSLSSAHLAQTNSSSLQ